jgi:hypothetical protein
MAAKKRSTRKYIPRRSSWARGVHDRIQELVGEQGSNRKFAKFLSDEGNHEINTRRITDWIGTRLPTAENLYKIAQKTGVSLDWLLGLSRDQYRKQSRNKEELATDLGEFLCRRIAPLVGLDSDQLVAFGDLILEDLVERQISVVSENQRHHYDSQLYMSERVRLDPTLSKKKWIERPGDLAFVKRHIEYLIKNQPPVQLVSRRLPYEPLELSDYANKPSDVSSSKVGKK